MAGSGEGPWCWGAMGLGSGENSYDSEKGENARPRGILCFPSSEALKERQGDGRCHLYLTPTMLHVFLRILSIALSNMDIPDSRVSAAAVAPAAFRPVLGVRIVKDEGLHVHVDAEEGDVTGCTGLVLRRMRPRRSYRQFGAMIESVAEYVLLRSTLAPNSIADMRASLILGRTGCSPTKLECNHFNEELEGENADLIDAYVHADPIPELPGCRVGAPLQSFDEIAEWTRPGGSFAVRRARRMLQWTVPNALVLQGLGEIEALVHEFNRGELDFEFYDLENLGPEEANPCVCLLQEDSLRRAMAGTAICCVFLSKRAFSSRGSYYVDNGVDLFRMRIAFRAQRRLRRGFGNFMLKRAIKLRLDHHRFWNFSVQNWRNFQDWALTVGSANYLNSLQRPPQFWRLPEYSIQFLIKFSGAIGIISSSVGGVTPSVYSMFPVATAEEERIQPRITANDFGLLLAAGQGVRVLTLLDDKARKAVNPIDRYNTPCLLYKFENGMECLRRLYALKLLTTNRKDLECVTLVPRNNISKKGASRASSAKATEDGGDALTKSQRPILPATNPLHELGERASAEREIAEASRPSTSEGGASRNWDRTSPYPANEKLIMAENALFLRHWMSYEDWFSREASRREAELKTSMVKVKPIREGRWDAPKSAGLQHAQTGELQRAVRELALQSALDIRAQHTMRPGSAANAAAWGVQSIFGGEYLRFSGLLKDEAGLGELLRYLKSDFRGDLNELALQTRSAIRPEGPPGLGDKFATMYWSARKATQIRREILERNAEMRRRRLQQVRERIARVPSNPLLRSRPVRGGFELPEDLHASLQRRVINIREAKKQDEILKHAVRQHWEVDLQRKKALAATMRAEHAHEMDENRLMLQHRSVSAQREAKRDREAWGLSTGSYAQSERQRVRDSAAKVKDAHLLHFHKRSHRTSSKALSNVVVLMQRRLTTARERDRREAQRKALHERVTHKFYRSDKHRSRPQSAQ